MVSIEMFSLLKQSSTLAMPWLTKYNQVFTEWRIWLQHYSELHKPVILFNQYGKYCLPKMGKIVSLRKPQSTKLLQTDRTTISEKLTIEKLTHKFTLHTVTKDLTCNMLFQYNVTFLDWISNSDLIIKKLNLCIDNCLVKCHDVR